MPVRTITAASWLGAQRGEAVVCIGRFAGGGDILACLTSVIAHTPDDVRVVVLGALDEREAQPTPTREVFTLAGSTTPDALDAVAAAAAPADLVVLDAASRVAPGWFEGLREAAGCDTTVATASPLDASELAPNPADLSDERFAELAATVREHAARLRPRVPHPDRRCVYVRRTALELAGSIGSAWRHDSQDADFFVGCVERGLCHVVADEVIAGHPDSGKENERPPGATGSYSRALGIARRATRGLSLVVDARILGGDLSGTQVQLLELLTALSRTGEVAVRAVVAPELDGLAREALAGLSSVELVAEAAAASRPAADVVHRPFQVFSGRDLDFLSRLGQRLVVSQLDLIGYRNPSYFADGGKWHGFQRLTRGALALADHVVFSSAHALGDALADDLVDPHRASVVHLGVDHAVGSDRVAARRPAGAAALPAGSEVLLCLGTDLRHKNRVFAIRLLEQLQHRHGWEGYLVFAGPHLQRGSSRLEESELLAASRALADRTIDLGAVDEPEKAWLLERADLVLYPTVYEGFGFIPFEAAARGVPCMWAPGTSLLDLLGASDEGILAWDAGASAERAFELLRDEGAARRNVEGIRAVGELLTWDSTARRLIEVYRLTCDRPSSGAAAIRRLAPEGAVSDDGLRLVGEGGALPRELERPLLAVATRPWLRRPLFGALKAGYRAARAAGGWAHRHRRRG